jgi:N-acetylneuraminic acid mutarotase
VVGSKIFIFGGISINQQFLNNIYILDTKNHQLTQLNVGGSHPSPRAGTNLFQLSNQLVLFGGKKKLEKYEIK